MAATFQNLSSLERWAGHRDDIRGQGGGSERERERRAGVKLRLLVGDVA